MKTLLATILLVVVSGNTAFAEVSASKNDLSKVEQKIERQLRVNPFAVIGLQVLKKQYDMCEKLMTSVHLIGPEEGPAAGDYQFVTQYNCDNYNGHRDSAEGVIFIRGQYNLSSDQILNLSVEQSKCYWDSCGI